MTRSRREFTKKTMRLALDRSGKQCEAVGAMYGLDPGKRCENDLAKGVEFDHIVLDANSKDNSLENCAAVCIKCHKWKTANHDIPMAAKTVRMQDNARGVRPKKKPIKSPGFAPPPKSANRAPKQALPPRALYREDQP